MNQRLQFSDSVSFLPFQNSILQTENQPFFHATVTDKKKENILYCELSTAAAAAVDTMLMIVLRVTEIMTQFVHDSD